MIDIHSHVLPGLDDGSQSMEETLELLTLARNTGTEIIVGSPHSDNTYTYDPERVDALIEEAQKLIGDGIRIVRGCDFHLMIDNIQNAKKDYKKYTINRGPYILMELSDQIIFPNTSGIWTQLEDVGIRIILTHPERNVILQGKVEKIDKWVEEGRYMQVTGMSLLGQFGPRALKVARYMLDRGLCHFVASDGHSVNGRPPRLDIAYAWMSEHYGQGLADLLFKENPRAVVEGKEVSIDLPFGRDALADMDEDPRPQGGFLRKIFGMIGR
jgi:protein-tyrosine phosphatase